MRDAFSLEGRVALVTGGSRGLGRAMARALASAGADVVLAARSAEALSEAAEEIRRDTGRRCLGLLADVTSEEQVEAMTARAIEAFGRIDVLINNAGINIRNPVLQQTAEEFRQVLDVNLHGAYLVARSVGRRMVEQRRGSVINVSSMLGLVGLAGRPAYTAAKGALLQLTRTMALEWAPFGVRVNALCPGPFVTEINTVVLEDPQARAFFLERIPLGRWGRPEELGPAAVFLASDASSFMTGAALVVDGGWTAQ